MTTTDTRELEQVLARAVHQFGEVQAGELRAKLPKPFQRPAAELTASLDALADRGEVFRHPTAKTKFLAFDPGAAVRGLLLESLGPKALTEAELKQQVAKKGASLGFSKAIGPLTAKALKALVSEGTAFVHRSLPPPGESKRPAPKTLRYASEPRSVVELRPYVRPAARELKALVKRLAPFGATVAEAFKAFALELGITLPGATTDSKGALLATPTANGGTKLQPDAANVRAVSTANPAAPTSSVVRPVAAAMPAVAEDRTVTANGSAGKSPGHADGSSGGTVKNPDGDRKAIVNAQPTNGAPKRNGAADDAARLLQALDEVAAREPPGALLSVALVRELAGLEKVAFDNAALKLARAQEVVLHFHDYPASLTPERRAQLVIDEEGTHYIGIVRWSKE